MDLKINFKKDSLAKIGEKIKNFWHVGNKWIFLSVWIILAASILFIWFSYVYNYEWNESQKNKYINENSKGVIFNQKKYEDILNHMSEKKVLSEEEDLEIKDIFGL